MNIIRKTLKRQWKRFQHIFRRIKLFKNWYTLVFPFNRRYPKERILLFRNGIKMFVPDVYSNDLAMVIEDWVANEYGELPQQGVITDAGAHIGSFSLLAAAKTHAHIFAIEPVPANFAILQKNIALNHLENRVTACEIALGGKSGTEKIFLNSINSAGHGFVPPKDVVPLMTESIEVRVQTLEDFLDEQPIAEVAFMKCDIEGSEYAMLFNASQECFSKIKTMIIEMHTTPPHVYADAKIFLDRIGYKTEWAKCASGRKMLHAWRENPLKKTKILDYSECYMLDEEGNRVHAADCPVGGFSW
jgi:FkbM family methyltransferase